MRTKFFWLDNLYLWKICVCVCDTSITFLYIGLHCLRTRLVPERKYTFSNTIRHDVSPCTIRAFEWRNATTFLPKGKNSLGRPCPLPPSPPVRSSSLIRGNRWQMPDSLFTQLFSPSPPPPPGRCLPCNYPVASDGIQN